jgi:hypothetical protein
MTSAGRRCRTGRSMCGNWTLTTSHTSTITIVAAVGLGRPLMESGEGIVDRFPLCLGQDYWSPSPDKRSQRPCPHGGRHGPAAGSLFGPCR